MQHIHRLGTRSQIDHAIGAAGVPHADLVDTGTDRSYGLPVFRLEAALHEVQIETGVPTRLFGNAFKSLRLEPVKCSGFRTADIAELYCY